VAVAVVVVAEPAIIPIYLSIDLEAVAVAVEAVHTKSLSLM